VLVRTLALKSSCLKLAGGLRCCDFKNPRKDVLEIGMARVALITGITGQDGSYLAELLLDQGYTVHGMVRRQQDAQAHDSQATITRHARIAHLQDAIHLHDADLLDQGSLVGLIDRVRPCEIYNLAAQTFIPLSWNEPIETADATGLGVARLLEAIRQVDKSIRFYQAGSSEMFGRARATPQNEMTGFWPRNPYAAAKVYGHWMTLNYRETYGMFACSGILFNHESPRRPASFVTRKITQTVARIKLGLASELRLGNLDAQRDWGFAADYVRAMWLTLQQDSPVDYVIGTGKVHRVRDFVAAAFEHVGLDWERHVVVDPLFYRPTEPYVLVADADKARRDLGWTPSVGFAELVQMMVDADLAALTSNMESPTVARWAA
jgi:GDPmannose 4,6-dehydratase